MPRSASARPVPDNATVLVPPSLVIVSVPAAEPAAVGVNTTCTAQVPPGAIGPAPEQPLLLTWNGPLAVAEDTVSALLPLLVTTTDCAALVVPIPCEPKVRAAGATEIPGLVPLPFSVNCCGPSLESLGKVRVAERAPTAPGVNVTLTEHEPCGGTTGLLVLSLGQLNVEKTKEKSPGFGPPGLGGPVR